MPTCAKREKKRGEKRQDKERDGKRQKEMRYVSLLVWQGKVREVESRRSRYREQDREGWR